GVGNMNAFGSGGLTLNDASTLIAVGGAQSFGNSVVLTGPVTVGGTNDLGINGAISGSGSLTDFDIGTLIFGGAGATNSYSGGNVVSAGTLEISNPGTLTTPLGTGSVTLNNGTALLLNTGPLTFNNSLMLNGSSTIEFPATLPVTGTLITWAGLISGTG